MFINEGGRFSNFWFSTGSPSFIFKVLKRQNIDIFDMLFRPVDSVILDSFDVANMQAGPLLLQTGYLTIDRVEILVCTAMSHPKLSDTSTSHRDCFAIFRKLLVDTTI